MDELIAGLSLPNDRATQSQVGLLLRSAGFRRERKMEGGVRRYFYSRMAS